MVDHLSPEQRRAIASKGGKAAHASGRAHQWSSQEAQAAGRKGGQATSRDREHMRAIAKKGGAKRRRTAQEKGKAA